MADPSDDFSNQNPPEEIINEDVAKANLPLQNIVTDPNAREEMTIQDAIDIISLPDNPDDVYIAGEEFWEAVGDDTVEVNDYNAASRLANPLNE